MIRKMKDVDSALINDLFECSGFIAVIFLHIWGHFNKA